MTGWINRTREKRRAENRRKRHQALIDAASSPTEKLQAACGWLISEARQAQQLEETSSAVLALVGNLRKEDSHDHRNYAA